jgi:hypothetical protein
MQWHSLASSIVAGIKMLLGADPKQEYKAEVALRWQGVVPAVIQTDAER